MGNIRAARFRSPPARIRPSASRHQLLDDLIDGEACGLLARRKFPEALEPLVNDRLGGVLKRNVLDEPGVVIDAFLSAFEWIQRRSNILGYAFWTAARARPRARCCVVLQTQSCIAERAAPSGRHRRSRRENPGAAIPFPCRSEADSYDPRQPEIRIARRVIKGGSHLCAPNYAGVPSGGTFSRAGRHFHVPSRVPLHRPGRGESGRLIWRQR